MHENAFLFRADNSDPHGMGQGVAHIPRRAGVTVSCSLSLGWAAVFRSSIAPYMYKIVENVDFVAGYPSTRFAQRCCPVYGIACKCDKNATTLEIKRK